MNKRELEKKEGPRGVAVSRRALVLWTATGLVLSGLSGFVTSVLALMGGSNLPLAIAAGTQSAGGFAGLWIATTALVYTITRPP